MSKNPEALLTTKEAARRLNVRTSFLAKARMMGTGPKFSRFGRAIRYPEAALDAYREANEMNSTSEY